MAYPASAGPDPLDPTQARMRLDDGNLPSQTTLQAEPNMNAGKHAMTHENAYRAAMLAEARIAYGWVQAPSGIDGSTPTTWTLTPAAGLPGGTGADNPTQNLDTLSEAFYTATPSAAGWLARGMKVRTPDGSGGWNYGIVSYVSGAVVGFLGPNTDGFANRFGVWGAQGHFTPSATMWYSSTRNPVGFPTNPMIWTAYIISPTSAGAKPNGSSVAISPIGDNSWRTFDTLPGTVPPTWLLRLPIGDWTVDLSCLIHYERDAAGDIGAQVGLSTTATIGGTTNDHANAPDGDLLWSSYDAPASGAAPTAERTVWIQADRTVNPADSPFGLWAKVKSGSNSRVLLRNDLKPTIIRARCTML